MSGQPIPFIYSNYVHSIYKEQVAFSFDRNKQNYDILMAVYKNKMYVLIVVTSEQVAGHTCQRCNKLRDIILWGSYAYDHDMMSGVYKFSCLLSPPVCLAARWYNGVCCISDSFLKHKFIRSCNILHYTTLNYGIMQNQVLFNAMFLLLSFFFHW
jgi:hypothetical protein